MPFVNKKSCNDGPGRSLSPHAILVMVAIFRPSERIFCTHTHALSPSSPVENYPKNWEGSTGGHIAHINLVNFHLFCGNELKILCKKLAYAFSVMH